jgi:hypothetical protein
MSLIKPSLFLVMSKFPDQKDAIKSLFLNNNNFQEICSDYQKCTEAIEYWRQSTLENACLRADEYSNLLLELEDEVRSYL